MSINLFTKLLPLELSQTFSSCPSDKSYQKTIRLLKSERYVVQRTFDISGKRYVNTYRDT